jgi:hypothetical protein
MEDRSFTRSLVRAVIQRAYEGGAPGSPEYQAAFAAGLTKLRNLRYSLDGTLMSGGGKQITSVSAGESVTWSAPMSVQDQFDSVVGAIEILEGRTYTVTRTTARFLY